MFSMRLKRTDGKQTPKLQKTGTTHQTTYISIQLACTVLNKI